MQKTILASVEEVILAAISLKTPEGLLFIEQAAKMIVETYKKQGKVIIAGNGGSLCDAMHFSEELTGFYRSKSRKALSAIALSEPGVITCVGNDVGFDYVFSRAVEAHAKPNDTFIALTTSGNSMNLINAAMTAKKQGAKTIAFLGKDGGKMKGLCDLEWIVKNFPFSDRIQEAHMAAIHIIIEMVEKELFSPKEQLKGLQSTLAAM
ncbi:MAG: SIS domain-containing protein [Chlamydiae bacterium]|nr:SIS domain-containing protein [Chlamydiota bacterium]